MGRSNVFSRLNHGSGDILITFAVGGPGGLHGNQGSTLSLVDFQTDQQRILLTRLELFLAEQFSAKFERWAAYLLNFDRPIFDV